MVSVGNNIHGQKYLATTTSTVNNTYCQVNDRWGLKIEKILLFSDHIPRDQTSALKSYGFSLTVSHIMTSGAILETIKNNDSLFTINQTEFFT